MKRTLIIVIVVCALAASVALPEEQEGKKTPGTHLGTWQLTSYKYGTNQTSFTDFPANQRRIKLITESHFTWVEFDATTKKVKGAAGGTYSLSGNAYTESMDFGLGMDSYLGEK